MASKALTSQSLSSNSPSSIVTSITRILQSINPNFTTNKFQSVPDLSQFSPHLNPNLVIEVINNQKNPNHALIFFNWASRPSPNPTNYTHNSSCYNAMFDLLLSNRLFTDATQFLESHNKLSDFMIAKIIKAYGAEHDINRAIDWFDYDINRAIDWFLRAKKVELDGNCIASLNSLLGVLVKDNKRVRLASEIFEQVMNEGLIRVNVVTYTMMITGYCRVGKIENALKLFDNMPCRPNKATYDAILVGLCNKGMMVAARQIVDKMLKKEDFSLDLITYSTLIDGYCKTGEMDMVMKYLDEAVNKGFKPNVRTYNSIVNRLCLNDKVDEAKNVIAKMRADGVKDDLHTHWNLLSGFCVAGRMDEAVDHLKDMSSSFGVNPDGKAFAMVLNELCKLGKPNDAIGVVKEMVAQGISPSVKSVNVVLKALVDRKELDEAFRYLKWMHDIGCTPNSLAYVCVIAALSKSRERVQQVEELIEFMRQNGRVLNPSIYSSLTNMYVECGELETASRVFYDALRDGCVIYAESFAAFVEGLCSKGKISDAEQHAQELFKKCPGTRLDEYKRILSELKHKYSDQKS